jgi:hypothetical protein
VVVGSLLLPDSLPGSLVLLVPDVSVVPVVSTAASPGQAPSSRASAPWIHAAGRNVGARTGRCSRSIRGSCPHPERPDIRSVTSTKCPGRPASPADHAVPGGAPAPLAPGRAHGHDAAMVRRAPGLFALLLACNAAPLEGETGAAGSTSSGSTGAAAPTGSTAPVPGDSSTGDPPTGGSDSLGGTTGTTTGAATTTGAPDPTTDTGDPGTGGTSTGDDTTGGPAPVLTLDHMQVKGTHNSYHVEPLVPFDASHEYSHKPLSEQLEDQGVRAFELDVHEGVSGFEVYHISVIDAEGTCDTLKGCLGEIHSWSVAHPLHLPIVVWIEVKDSTGGFPIDAADLDKLDDAIRGVLPPGQLFTPDDLQGGHASVRAALETDGWPAIDAVRGQVIVVLLNVDDDHAKNYTANYTTLAGRAMFARATPAQFAAPWAAIAKLGVGDPADITAAHAARLLIATNVCGAGEDDDACIARLAEAKAAGIHMLKDDFPGPIDGKPYFLDFPDGNPARCNPVTAPPGCTSAALEDL